MKAFFAQNRWNAALFALAVCVLLPTCWYRFGIDQSLYEYVGCGVLHGKVPYRDAFDVKSPGIFFAYAVASVFFGCGQLGIRVFEFVLVLATGWAVARAASPGRHVDGVAGASALLLAGFHAFSFGFWDTAQAELSEGAFLAFAFAVSAAPDRARWRDVASGVLAGAACVFKVPAAIGVAILVARYATVRTPTGRGDWRGAGRFLLGVSVPVLAVVSYFIAHGALRFLLEWALYLPHYAAAPLDADWTAWLGPEMLLARSGPWLGAFAVPIAVGLARGRERTAAGAFLLVLAGFATIVLQRRYFSYHASVLGPLLALSGAYGLARAFAWSRGASSVVVVLTVFGAFFGAPPWTENEHGNYRVYVLHTWWPRVRGKLGETAFDLAFGGPFGYSYVAQAAVARVIQDAKPERDAGLHVRGFDPTLYVLTGLRSPSRFMMESPVQDPYLSSYRPGWVAEHDDALFGERAPRFFVTQVGYPEDIRRLTSAGWGLRASRDRYVVLDRTLGTTPMDRSAVVAFVSGKSFRGGIRGGFPLSATFDASGAVTARIVAKEARGTWSVSEDGSLCAQLEGLPETCGAAYSRGDRITVFQPDGREFLELARD